MSLTILIVFAILAIALAIYMILIEPYNVEVLNFKIKDDSLKGLRLVAASDFHFNPYQNKRVFEIVDLINAQKPDIVVSMGDFVSGKTKKSTLPIEKIAEGLAKIKTKYGFYTVLGNHDIVVDEVNIAHTLEKNNIKVLLNSNVKVQIEDKTLYIAGVEDLREKNPDIELALSNIDSKNPIILLTHSPDIFPDVLKDVNLTLAGHVHGGQVRCPYFGALLIPSKYGNRYSKGLIEEDNKKMIVSKGLGNSLLPIRFNCRPDILVIDFI